MTPQPMSCGDARGWDAEVAATEEETPVAEVEQAPEAAPAEEAEPVGEAAEPAGEASRKRQSLSQKPSPSKSPLQRRAFRVRRRARGRGSSLPRRRPPPEPSLPRRPPRSSRRGARPRRSASACRARSATRIRSRARPPTRKPIRGREARDGAGRRQERRGVVVSDKGDKSIVVKVETIRAHRKYKKVVRRSTQAARPRRAEHGRRSATRPHRRDAAALEDKRWRLAEIVEKAQVGDDPAGDTTESGRQHGCAEILCIRVAGGSRRRYARVGDIITATVKTAARRAPSRRARS